MTTPADELRTAARLEHLHTISDLDWGLIANLTGVSLNAVHRCLTRPGAPFPPRAAECLEALIKLVESSPATTPEGRHDWLRESIVDGRTRIQWFAAPAAATASRSKAPATPPRNSSAPRPTTVTSGDRPAARPLRPHLGPRTRRRRGRRAVVPTGRSMSGPTSTPRGEHTPRPSVTWQTELVRTEQLVDDDAPDPTPPNRATRRAIARAARRTK